MSLKRIIKSISRIVAFISAISLIADMIFDGLQCKTYYDFAYEESPSENIKISKWYFICSVTIWAGPPSCLILFWVISYYNDDTYGESYYAEVVRYKDRIGKRQADRLFEFERPPWDKNDMALESNNSETKPWNYCDLLLYLLIPILLTATLNVYLVMPYIVIASGVYGVKEDDSMWIQPKN